MHMPMYEQVFFVVLSLVCMLGTCGLSVAAWYHKDLRVMDVMRALTSIVVYGVITWIIFTR